MLAKRRVLKNSTSGEDAARLSDDNTCESVALVDSRGQVVTSGEGGEECTYERVTSSVSVNDRALINWCHRDVLDGALFTRLASHDNSGLGTHGDNHLTWAGHICLLGGGNNLGSTNTISGLKTISLGKSSAFVLVAEDVLRVLDGLFDLIHEEHDNEGGGEVEAKDLVIGGGKLANSADSLSIGVNKEASCVEELCASEISL